MGQEETSATDTINTIHRQTRRKHSAEEKICQACRLKPQCTTSSYARVVVRSIH